MGSKKNKDDQAKQALLQQQQAADRARADAENARAQEAQNAYAAQQAQYGSVLERESAADRALQERLMQQQYEQAGQDRGIYQSAMDRYLDQQQAAQDEQKRLTDLGLGQQAEDRADYRTQFARASAESPLEQQYGQGLSDWFSFMNGGQGGAQGGVMRQQPVPEYAAGSDPKAYVDSLYQSMLGRPADDAGRDFWASQLAAEGPQKVIDAFKESGEYKARAATPEAGVDATGGAAPSRYRDYTNAPGLIHSGLFESAQKRREDERTALGARQFGAQGANANLLGLQKQQYADAAAQRFGGQAAKAVTDRDAEMNARVMPFLGYQAGNRQNLLNTAAGLAENRLSGLTGLAAGGAANLGGIVGQLGSMAQGGQQNLAQMAQGGARGGLSQLYGTTSGAATGLGSQLLSGANNNAANSTGLYSNFQVRETPSFLSQLLGPALQIGTGLATGGMSALAGGASKGVGGQIGNSIWNGAKGMR